MTFLTTVLYFFSKDLVSGIYLDTVFELSLHADTELGIIR